MRRILIIITCTALTLFSIFGFMGTFEPVDNQFLWRSLYALLILGSILGGGRQLRTADS